MNFKINYRKDKVRLGKGRLIKARLTTILIARWSINSSRMVFQEKISESQSDPTELKGGSGSVGVGGGDIVSTSISISDGHSYDENCFTEKCLIIE